MFEPRLALASLSGQSDASWARAGLPYAGAAFLGGIAIDVPSREAAAEMVADRDREEFLPPDPLAFIDAQLSELDDTPLTAGVNVRSTTTGPIRAAAEICLQHDAILEVNAHCRQEELCAVGCGQQLLTAPAQLAAHVKAAAVTGVSVSVKLRTEVPGVDLVALAPRLVSAGASVLHIDAMDSEPVVGAVVEAVSDDVFVIANNGVRDRRTVREYLALGADAVSVGRPSDNPAVLRSVRKAVDDWFDVQRSIQPEPSVDRP